MKITVIDTETTGLPLDMNAPVEDLDNWPRIVGIAWQTWVQADENCFELETEVDHIIRPEGFRIPEAVTKIHGISDEHACLVGADLSRVLYTLQYHLKDSDLAVMHNVGFDWPIIRAEFIRTGVWPYFSMQTFCTKERGTDICKIPKTSNRFPGRYKWPSLDELYYHFFETQIPGREVYHGALVDVRATAECYFKMIAQPAR